MNSKALTKLQPIALTAIVAVAALSGSVAYYLWLRPPVYEGDIKVGIIGDLDAQSGPFIWKAAVLAAEQVNAEGGVLGRNITIVAEDDDDETGTYQDIEMQSKALNRLINVDKADFVFSSVAATGAAVVQQDICAEHKKINFFVRTGSFNLTQRVLENHDKYKYTFKLWSPNSTAQAEVWADQFQYLGSYTGFTKLALIGHDATAIKETFSILDQSLSTRGFDVVYTGYVPPGITDLTSYFAYAEDSGAQVIVPYFTSKISATFVKEWYDRQSPFVVWGFLGLAGDSNFWELTEGKCESICFLTVPAAGGYPLTNKTTPTLDSYLERWGERMPGSGAIATYDGIRFILPDAIRRAGTTETEAVVRALEAVDIETSLARHLVFGSSHDVMVGKQGMKYPVEDYFAFCFLQWQADKTLAIVAPESLMKEAGTTYQYPSWNGAWPNK